MRIWVENFKECKVGSTWSLCQELMFVKRDKHDCAQRHTPTHMGKSRENEDKMLWERDIFNKCGKTRRGRI